MKSCGLAQPSSNTRAVFLPSNRDAPQDTAQFINELPGRLKMVRFTPDAKEARGCQGELFEKGMVCVVDDV